MPRRAPPQNRRQSRDATAYPQSNFNDRRSRPKQPARLPQVSQGGPAVVDSANRFLLIHNEFEVDDAVANPVRGFVAWISQTPRRLFVFMEHISLCGYAAWPNRILITLDLKNKRVVEMRHYSIYGHELPIYQQSFIDSTVQALDSKADEDGFVALQAVLVEQDGIFRISKQHVSSPPGRLKRTPPAVGWEYVW